MNVRVFAVGDDFLGKLNACRPDGLRSVHSVQLVTCDMVPRTVQPYKVQVFTRGPTCVTCAVSP
jgi:hypothetical protein